MNKQYLWIGSLCILIVLLLLGLYYIRFKEGFTTVAIPATPLDLAKQAVTTTKTANTTAATDATAVSSSADKISAAKKAYLSAQNAVEKATTSENMSRALLSQTSIADLQQVANGANANLTRAINDVNAKQTAVDNAKNAVAAAQTVVNNAKIAYDNSP
jgi:hypothetical protein